MVRKTTSRAATYDLLASLLAYPTAELETNLNDFSSSIRDANPELDSAVAQDFADWQAQVELLSLEDRQEVYARTFDMSPKCTLEIGWHLFGEQYDRGTFLVWMRGQLRELELSESTDLPDHARHALAVLGRLESEKADNFATACVLPALEITCDGLAELKSPYEKLLRAICKLLESQHGPSQRDLNSLPVLNGQHEELFRAESV